MVTTEAPGLTADWINAWLAAIGITVLVPGVRLSWSGDALPVAVFHAEGDESLAARVANWMPSVESVCALAIARTHGDTSVELPRKVLHDAYASRAVIARRGHDPSLASSLTDLDGNEFELAHSPFDPPAPRGVTLHDRVVSAQGALASGDVESLLQETFNGAAGRVNMNGLGFDYRRLGATDVTGGPMVNLGVEVLAFYGLAFIPVRGDGRSARARGFVRAQTRDDAFAWPVWNASLDRWAIDALLDRFWSSDPRTGSKLPRPVFSAYGTIAYEPMGSADVSRGYASRRIG